MRGIDVVSSEIESSEGCGVGTWIGEGRERGRDWIVTVRGAGREREGGMDGACRMMS